MKERAGFPTPTADAVAVGMLAALLLFIALNLQAGWVYAVDAMLLSLLGVGWLSCWISARGIVVAREIPRQAVEGERLRVTVDVRTRRWARHFVELRDPDPALLAEPLVIPILSPGHPVRLTVDAVAGRRGVHRFEAMEVRAGGLTGLFTARARVPAPAGLVVFPRYWTLDDLPAAAGAAEEHTSLPQVRREGTEVAGVRDFREGDTMRHVHWRSTARRGAVVVKEFSWQVSEAPVVLLDTRASVHTAGGDDGTFENLARAAATIAQFITRSGRSVHLIAGDGAGERAVMGWRQALHFLAALVPDHGRPPLEQYQAAVPPGTPAVVISPDADGVAALAQHGAPIIAVLLDAESMLLQALGVPVAVVRAGEEVGACLQSWIR